MPDTSPLTKTLCSARKGNTDAAAQLLPLVYDELRAVAGRLLRREAPGHSLQPTAIVHEAYLRLIDQSRADWRDRAHFCAVAAEAIRRVLVDHARKRHALKRGGSGRNGVIENERKRHEWGRLSLSGIHVLPSVQQIDLLALNEALEQLEEMHERQASVVKLRFFGGLTNEEIAHHLGVHRSTVVDDWTAAKAWLLSRLYEGEA